MTDAPPFHLVQLPPQRLFITQPLRLPGVKPQRRVQQPAAFSQFPPPIDGKAKIRTRRSLKADGQIGSGGDEKVGKGNDGGGNRVIIAVIAFFVVQADDLPQRIALGGDEDDAGGPGFVHRGDFPRKVASAATEEDGDEPLEMRSRPASVGGGDNLCRQRRVAERRLGRGKPIVASVNAF